MPKNCKWAQIDSQILSIRNIMLDSYLYSTFDKRVDQMLSRHHLITKVILEQLNVSVSSCPDPASYPPDRFPISDLNFAVSTAENHKMRSWNSEIFYSGETFVVKFASAFQRNSRQSVFVLIGPIGWKVFIVTVCTAVSIIWILWVSSKLYDSLKIESVISAVLRPLLDQCEERKLPTGRFYFRLILLTWLFYCLLVTETYRSELISHMMKHPKQIWMNTFEELSEDTADKCMVVGVGSRPGQDFEDIILSEAINSLTEKRKRRFLAILRKKNHTIDRIIALNRTKADKEIAEGSAIIIGDLFIIELFSDALETLAGARFYEPSSEGLPRKIFWSVKYGPFQESILGILKWLRDFGILRHFLSQQDIIDRSILDLQVTQFFINVELRTDLESDVARKEETLKLKHVRITILLLLIGLLFSSVSLMIEMVICTCKASAVSVLTPDKSKGISFPSTIAS
jgi:hypothetical protein